MMILPVSHDMGIKQRPLAYTPKKSESVSVKNTSNFNAYNSYIASLNKMHVSFGNYQGDRAPAQKMFYHLNNRNNHVDRDYWIEEHICNQVGSKRWANARPDDLLKRSPADAIRAICTIIRPDNPSIPWDVPTPNYGDKWGRHANYIEINPRIGAKFDGDALNEGLFGILKLLPAIPPSGYNNANCLILSEFFKPHSGDGTKYGKSLYTINLVDHGISNTLLSPQLNGKVGADEQVKAFNDLAHAMGFKTGFRVLLSEKQMWVNGEQFCWAYKDHEEMFINECVNAIDLGFDAIYFDSGKHVIDKEGYCGQGFVPDRDKMAYITKQIRERSHRNDLSFVAEMAADNTEYERIGFSAGTGLGDGWDKNTIIRKAREQGWNDSYAAGFEVTNDNYENWFSPGDKLHRLDAVLSGYNDVNDKLPAFMQIDDIFPLSPFTSTHDLMLNIRKMDGHGNEDCIKHWDGIFSTSEDAQHYRNIMNDLFIKYM